MHENLRLMVTGMIATGALFAVVNASGQTNAIQSGNWSDPLTWSALEPDGATPAIVNGGFTVALDAASETTNLVDLGTISGETGNLSIAAGGDLVVAGAGTPSIRLGQAAGSTGNLTMTGGSVDIQGASPSDFAVGDALIGDNGTGTMTLSGGTFTAADEVFVGLGGTSNGTLNVSGGTLNVAGRNLLIAFFDGSTGNFNLSGDGIVNVGGFLFNSFDPGATSMLTQSGGTLNVGVAFVHGRQGNATYNHSGGAINVPAAGGNGDFVVGDNGPNNSYNISGTATATVGRNFLVGVFPDAQGTVNQSEGTIDVAGVLRVGIDGIGNWNQEGGITNVAGSAWLGDFDTSHGTYQISGGTLNITGNLSVGGALASNAPAVPMGTQGQALDADGTFIVSGSGGEINVGGVLLANDGDHTRRRADLTGDNVSTLIFEVLDGSGVSSINVVGNADLTGADIDVDILGGSFAAGATFDLITAASISNDFLSVAEDAGVFHLDVVTGGNGQILRATLVPEPASLALWSCAMLACSARLKSNRRVGARK